MSSRPPILFLHGWGGSFRRTYLDSRWIEALSGLEVPVIGIDLPGHADPGASHNPRDYDDLAGLVAAQLPAGQCDIIGYSLGAKISLALASRFPDRIRKLALFGIGDNAFVVEPSANAVIEALECGVKADTAPTVADLIADARRSGSDPAALAAVLRRAPNPIATADSLARITAQTMIVNSREDQLAIPDGQLRTGLPGTEYLLISGPVHSALPESEQLKSACLRFVLDAQTGGERGQTIGEVA